MLFRGVFTVLPVWVTSEGCSFVGKVHSEVTELSMPVFSTGMSLAFLRNAEIQRLQHLNEGEFDEKTLQKLVSKLSSTFEQYKPDKAIMLYLNQHKTTRS